MVSFGYGASSSSSGPWGPQQPYLEEGFDWGRMLLRGQDIGGRGNPNRAGIYGAFGEPQTADLDPRIYQGTDMVGTGASYIPEIAHDYHGWGQSGTNMMRDAANYFQRGRDNGFYNPADIPQHDSSLPFSMAERSMNDPTVQARIDAAGLDVRKMMGKDLAGVMSESVGARGVDNTRFGLRDAEVIDNYGRMMGGISSDIRGGAYNRGYGTGEQMMNQMYGTETDLFSGDIQNRINAGIYGGEVGQWGMGLRDQIPGMYAAGGSNLFNAGEDLRGAEQDFYNQSRAAFYEPWVPYEKYMNTVGATRQASESSSMNIMGGV
jgi:hypothetical protein